MKVLADDEFWKFASGETEFYFLCREAHFLRSSKGDFIPEFLSFEEWAPSLGVLKTRRIEGVSLKDANRKELDQFHNLREQLRCIIDSIHTQGFSHLDLKPSNILLSNSTLYLVDWGGYRRLGDELERHQPRQFTLGYSHPDLIFGKGLVRSDWDLYSLSRIGEFLHKKQVCPAAAGRTNSLGNPYF